MAHLLEMHPFRELLVIFDGGGLQLDGVEEAQEDEEDAVPQIADHDQVDLMSVGSEVYAELVVYSIGVGPHRFAAVPIEEGGVGWSRAHVCKGFSEHDCPQESIVDQTIAYIEEIGFEFGQLADEAVDDFLSSGLRHEVFPDGSLQGVHGGWADRDEILVKSEEVFDAEAARR